jgi:hypothetical protein
VPRYYFHFRDGELIEDETGEELASVEAARQMAQEVARELAQGGESPATALVVTDGRQVLFEVNLNNLR